MMSSTLRIILEFSISDELPERNIIANKNIRMILKICISNILGLKIVQIMNNISDLGVDKSNI